MPANLPAPPKVPARIPVCYGYARVSTKGQATFGKSMEEQETQIRNFYHQRGGDKFAVWGDIYRDAGVSAGKVEFANRPAAGVLAQRLRKGDHIVLTSLDRGFRNFRDMVNTIDAWIKRGVQLHLLDYQISTDNHIGRAMLSMFGVFGQLMRDMASDRTCAVQRQLRVAGKLAFRDCEFGWKVVGPKGHRKLAPDEPARETIRLITKLRDEDQMAFEAIFFYLIEHRIFTNNLPNTGGKVKHRQRGEWSRKTIEDAYYYFKRNPEFRPIKREMVLESGGKPLGPDWKKRMCARREGEKVEIPEALPAEEPVMS